MKRMKIKGKKKKKKKNTLTLFIKKKFFLKFIKYSFTNKIDYIQLQ